MSEAYLTHTDYQKAVEKLLIYYGFSTWREFWIPIDGEMGRLDVYGSCARSDLCDKTTVAVEISRSSRLEKDINRVYKSQATYGFVLAIKLIEIPPVAGRNIFVVRSLSEFENKLREVLKISEDYPRITPRIIEEVPIPKYNNLDEAFERFNIPINLRERARKLLLHAYTTCYDLYVGLNYVPELFNVELQKCIEESKIHKRLYIDNSNRLIDYIAWQYTKYWLTPIWQT